jgi:hypothetical protein
VCVTSNSPERSKWAAPPAPFLTAGLLVLLAYLAMDYVFDRYLFVLIPPTLVVVLVVMRGARFSAIPASVLLIVFLVFSLMGVADYFAWNSVRWQAARFATDELGCPAEQVDAGFEWGGWMNYDKFDQLPTIDRTSPVSWWWVRNPRYVVTFNRLPGYDVVRRFEYRTPFSRQVQYLLLTERPPGGIPESQRTRETP